MTLAIHWLVLNDYANKKCMVRVDEIIMVASVPSAYPDKSDLTRLYLRDSRMIDIKNTVDEIENLLGKGAN